MLPRGPRYRESKESNSRLEGRLFARRTDRDREPIFYQIAKSHGFERLV